MGFVKFGQKDTARYANPRSQDVAVGIVLGTLAAEQEVDECTPEVVSEHFWLPPFGNVLQEPIVFIPLGFQRHTDGVIFLPRQVDIPFHVPSSPAESTPIGQLIAFVETVYASVVL